MKLKLKVLLATGLIFFLHFIVDIYYEHQTIKTEVIEGIKDDARVVRGILMSIRRVYQNVFITHDIPINGDTINFLPAHSLSRISKEFSNWVDTGLSFNNVSDVPRNKNNRADQIEMMAIEFFRQNPDVKERFVPFETNAGKQFYHFSQPIYIKPQCLKCHGKKENAPISISERYQTAFNYSVGDLRGIMSIKLPADIINQKINELFKQNLIKHLLGFVAVFGFIYFLLDRFVLTRIDNLKTGTENIVQGDYSTVLASKGKDEISDVIKHFNLMSQAVSEREQSLIKQRSLYAALSQTNKSIIQLNTAETLFQRVCEIAIQQPGITFVWFLEKKNSDASELVPIASAGKSTICRENNYISIDPNHARNCGPIATAFHNKTRSIVNDYQNDVSTRYWQDQAKLANIHATAALPIIINNESIAILAVYADTPDYFNQDTVALLEEMVGDLAYAVQHYQLEQQHKITQQQLQQSSLDLQKANDLMSMLMESTGEGIYGLDIEGRCTFVNRAALKMLGFTSDELLGEKMHELTHHSYADGVYYPSQECHIHRAYMHGQGCEINSEVFWRKDGTSIPVQYSAYPMHDKDNNIMGAVTVFHDLTKHHEMERKIDYLATHDPLTSLLNRYSFEQRLNLILETSSADDHHMVCYLDLDQFKVINDTCGHLAGDEMIKEVAEILGKTVRTNDTLARLGGDEFGLLLENCSVDKAKELGNSICERIKAFHFHWEKSSFLTSVSIGMVPISAETLSIQQVMSTADTACYVAKEMGRNRVHIYQSDDHKIARQHSQMQYVSIIEQALENNLFKLYKQAIVSSQPEQSHKHFEILLRMYDKEDNMIAPDMFIPAAEKYGLMNKIDRWVINAVFEYMQAHSSQLSTGDFISINLSGASLVDQQLLVFIDELVNQYKLDSNKICFEVTETAAISQLEQAKQFISRLRAKGFLFALDDFGTGMSSFAYLKNLPVDFLKIDGTFVKDMLDDPIDRAMVKSINDIGHIMGLKTIAEYVENDRIKHELRAMNVDFLQGYGIEKPNPLI